MSAEVQTLLGPFGAAQARKEAQDAQCAICTRMIPSSGEANIVVTRSDDPAEGLQVYFTHPTCAPSTVTTLATGSPRNPAGDDMRMTALPAPAHGRRLPILVAELACPVFVAPNEHAELTGVLSPYLQEHGFGLASDTTTPPPPAAEGWAAVLAEDPAGAQAEEIGVLSIADAQGTDFFIGTIHTPPTWRRTALERGTVALYVGPARLDPTDPDTAAQCRQLQHAALGGHLLAATVPLLDYAAL
ncbi:hypothetical protein [Streptomyces chrestomyceticus]|uniref:hypothetical protein n=1 Tax=Streptomyces chrestomyceticus TaxID=68185 RepID=UPI0035A8539E